MKKIILLLISLSPLLLFAQKGELIKSLKKTLPTNCIKLSPNEKFIAIGDGSEDPLGFQDLDEKYKIAIFTKDDYSKIYEYFGHKESIESIDFNSDSEKIVSADKNGTIIIWGLKPWKKIVRIETNEWVHDVKFIDSGNKIIAIQGYEKVALVYDMKGNLITELNVGKQIDDFEVNNKTNNIFFGCYDELQVWSLISRKKIRSIPFSGLMCIKFNHDYSKLAIGKSSGDVVIMTPKLKEIKRLKGHFKPVLTVSFNFDDTLLASGSSDQTARIWDLKKQKETVKLINVHKGKVNAIAFISDNNIFITGGENKLIKIWK